MKLKKDVQNNVINDYFFTNLKTYEIAEKYQICRQSVRNIILKNKLKLKERNINVVLNIINDYNNHHVSNKILSQKYGLHRSTIQQILIKNGIQLRLQNYTSRKHTLTDVHYFNRIDTEEKAYILGLLFADGNINKNGFEISLAETDKELLDKLSIIFYNKIILGYRKSKLCGKYVSKPQYRLIVTSQIIKNDLIKHGCVQSKTFKIVLPKLNIDLYRHFIRGYFDGDGSICIPSKKPQNITITITSNKKFCDELAEYIKSIINVNTKSIIRYKNVGCVRLTGRKQIIRFMNWIYTDSNLFLERKFNKYKNYIN
jgi:predicted DNA-binding protein YlxM (UPF0122 family)